MSDTEELFSRLRYKQKKEEKPVVKIDEEMLLNELKRRYVETGRNVLCKSTTLAKKLGGSPYVVRGLLLRFEEDGLVENTGLSHGPIIWRTKFGNKK